MQKDMFTLANKKRAQQNSCTCGQGKTDRWYANFSITFTSIKNPPTQRSWSASWSNSSSWICKWVKIGTTSKNGCIGLILEKKRLSTSWSSSTGTIILRMRSFLSWHTKAKLSEGLKMRQAILSVSSFWRRIWKIITWGLGRLLILTWPIGWWRNRVLMEVPTLSATSWLRIPIWDW